MSDAKIKRLDRAWNAQHKTSEIESGSYSPLNTVCIEHTINGLWGCPTTKEVYRDISDLHNAERVLL